MFFLTNSLTICSLYLLYRFTLSELQNLASQLPSYKVLEDYNSHNPLWGGDILDPKQRITEDLDNNSVLLFNDGSFTYHNICTNIKSAVDLSICSSSIFLDFTWWADDHLHRSDHFPIYIKANKSQFSTTVHKWKLRESN